MERLYMMTKQIGSFVILLMLICCYSCWGQSSAAEGSGVLAKEPKSAMLLGVYHFNNPGKDTYNLQVDDYFSDSRQKEIEQVVQALIDYKPTKIFVEFTTDNQPTIDSLYALYLEDKLTLKEIGNGKNEVYQIGFRLGKKLGGIEIMVIDHPGNWLGPYAEFIADTLSLQYYNNDKINTAEQLEARQKMFSTNTVRENLIYLNKWEQIMNNHSYYNNVAIKVKDTANVLFTYQETEQEINGLPYQMRSFDFNNIGVDLVAEWYKRNLFIYRNIIENTRPNDKVIIIIGSGHIRYLHQLLGDNPEFSLVNPNDYLNEE